MNVSAPKRLFLCIIAVLIGTSAFAKHPSPRSMARLVYDSEDRVSVLFGGRGRFDRGTALTYDTNETWFWTGADWVQQFPEVSPPRRNAHSMVYDRVNDRTIVFAGRQEKSVAVGPDTLLNDVWAFTDDRTWVPLGEGSVSRPPVRAFAGLAHDPKRDVLVVFGGHEYQPLKPKQKTPDLGPVYDTWEFSNGNWTKMGGTAPQVARPLLEWDPVREQVVMMGIDGTNATPVMYRYNGDGSWTKETPAKLPTCIAEGHFMVQSNGRLLFIGGACPGNATPPEQELFEYDDETWTEITIGVVGRGIGQAVAYDTFRDRVIVYGGTALIGGDPFANTFILTEARFWRAPEIKDTPDPRSWMVFESDPLQRGIVMFGGLQEEGGIYNVDVWQYASGTWSGSPAANTAPPDCLNPVTTFDTDRNVALALCSGNNIWQFDGTEWKDFGTTNIPDERRFTGIAYDARLKKVVLFGGFFNNNYRNDTWLWDGTKWTELDIDNDDRPPHRGNFVMWYDSALQRTVLYGGIGRPNLNSKVTRFSDMWSFDGTRWTKMSVTTTPGVRFRPLIRVNPTNGKLLLFGGLRSENIDEDSIRQFYGNDTWEWDGASSTWTELHPEHRPPARQNGGMAWDPTANEMVIYGGWAEGFSHSDVWAWNGVDWRPIPDAFFGPKRRSAR